MGKGEIARYEQFLLFPQFFQKAYFPGASKSVIVWEWVKPFFEQTFLNVGYQFRSRPGASVVSVSQSWPGGCKFATG